MTYLMVKDFARFQHYRDRGPVWIKLYNAVMDDEAFLALSDAARGHLILIWLLASRRDNKLPNDARAIGRAIQSTGRVDLERFIAAGFLLPYQSASALLAEPEQDASALPPAAANGASPRARPRARGEGEKEKEGEKTPPPRGAKQPAPWLGRFGAAWHGRYDGDMPTGPAVGPLRRLIRQHGEDEVFRRWTIYLGATEGRFAAPAKFAATWGDWETAPVIAIRGGVQINTPAQARAAALWERYKAANLLTKWERPEYERIGAAEVAAGHYATVDDFLAELRVTKPWTLRDARTDGYAVNEIATRLAPARQATA